MWNMLKKLAVFAKAYVYADRRGKIRVVRAGSVTGNSGVEITPDNAFSYNLPGWNRTIVNKVKAEFSEFVSGDRDDDRFTISRDNFREVKNAEGMVTHYEVDLELKNFHGEIRRDMIRRYNGRDFLPGEELNFQFEIIDDST